MTLDHSPGAFTALGNGLNLFSYVTDTHGSEPWVTNGTRRGTRLLRDINPGASSGFQSWFPSVALGDGRALFSANDGTRGQELWVTDGTRRGTRMVADLFPGSSSSPDLITPIGGGRAMFTAIAAGVGRRIHVTDGTTRGTTRLSHPLNPTTMAHLGDGRVIFAAYVNAQIGTQLHITDGTDDGTRIIRELPVPRNGYRHFLPLGDGRMLFWHVHDTPYELWITDGTRAGTRRIGNAGTLHINSFGPHTQVAMGDGRALFIRQDRRGVEPWVTDGTRPGTRRLRDINRGNHLSHSYARGFTVLGQFPTEHPLVLSLGATATGVTED